MSKLVSSLTSLALASLATTASAVTITGAVTPKPGELDLYQAVDIGTSGHYAIGYQFSRPGVGSLDLETTFGYNFYDIATGTYLGGDEQLSTRHLPFTPPKAQGAATYWLPPVSRHLTGFGELEVDYYLGKAILYADFTGVEPVTYSFTVDRLSVDVPEPATWALMILGFGATGVALRRRRRVPA